MHVCPIIFFYAASWRVHGKPRKASDYRGSDSGEGADAATGPAQQDEPQLVKVATQIAQMIDQDKAGEVWDNASDVAKTRVPRDAFIKQVAADRIAAGPLQLRQLGGVSSFISDGAATAGVPATPAGTYINIAFATHFGTHPQPVRELVSFHLDSDQNWRVTGYTLR